MSSKELRRQSISQSLSQIAIALIVAVVALLTFALDKRDVGPLFWVLVIVGVSQ